MKFVYHIRSEEMLKTFLQRHHYSKKTISAIKRDGALIINKQPVTVRHMLKKDDELIIQLPDEFPSTYLLPSNKNIEILYEDTYLIIVSKPVHLNCAPSREHPHDSLIERVMYYLNHSMNRVQYVVPHIVTRLDRNTTGIVIFTKHGHIHHLMSTFEIEKRYICVCYGKTKDHSMIEAPIGRNKDSIITRCITATGKYAKTEYKTLSSHQNASLCEVKLHTGRTHQIRVHFNHIGHPLIGDELYDGFHPLFQTQSLQCYKVKFIHPIYNKKIEIIIDYKNLENIYQSIILS